MSQHHTAKCRLCQERKEQIEFPVQKNKRLMPDGSYTAYNVQRRICFSCVNKQQADAKLKRLKSDQSVLEYNRAKTRKCLFKKFGLTVEEGESILRDQEFKCKICCSEITLDAESDRNQKAVLDHCHSTGKFRGFLCHKCNVGIGQLGDSPDLVKKALDYLLAHIIVP